MPEAAGVLEPGRRQPLSPVRSIMRTLRPLSIRRASLIYVFAAIFLIFSLWVPETFLTTTTLRTLLDEQAFTAIAALGLIVPLAAGVFDLAIGSEVGMGVILVAWLLSKQGLPPALAIAVTLCAGALIGLANGLLVTRARINSFIATLGISSVLTAMITWVSGGNEILNLKVSFESIASKTLFGIQYPVY